MITIAIAKGRMQESALSLFARAGIRPNGNELNSRRLALTDESGRYRFRLLVRANPVSAE